MIYTVVFEGGAIATLSNVKHIYDGEHRDLLAGDPELKDIIRNLNEQYEKYKEESNEL